MMRFHEEPGVVERARDAALDSDRPLVLAVSGGLDSMSLLDAMAVASPDRIAAVATFDHATGAHDLGRPLDETALRMRRVDLQ